MDNCIFCKIARNEAKSWRIFESEKACAFLDINPISEFHTLVISKNHYVNIFDVPEEELLEIMKALKKVVQLYEDKLGLKDVQIISNSGRAAQQDVFHIHFHIIPRKKGDGNNLKWITHPEFVPKFDEMVSQLK
ncbi:MAG: HIT family protein [Saprospiraceae bacterium]|nr:HIT family protein [Saprospiraceae bacterium]